MGEFMKPTWGGKRQGAGRPKGSGKFGVPTQAIRVPAHQVDQILSYLDNKTHALPLYGAKVSAGFPSPADDFLEGSLDLNEHLIQHPSATFFVRATGDSMINAGIFPNDILVVDRSLEVKSGKVIIAVINGELTVKRLIKQDDTSVLHAENPAYPPIRLSSDMELAVWGVVTNVIHAV